MIDSAQIAATLSKLAGSFLRCYEVGEQSRDLNPMGGGAFGQFLDQPASHHRGIHGTAAALRVLASLDRADAQSATTQIVRYLTHRIDIEGQIGSHETRDDRVEKATLDEDNVIKNSEVLYALKFVKATVPERHDLATRIAGRLHTGIVQGKGWPYFLGDGSIPQPLPTAYAVRALAMHQYDVREPVQYLVTQLESPASRQTDIWVQVACIFVLAYLPSGSADIDDDKLKSSLLSLWGKLEPLLRQDLEANIEYTYKDLNYYVRVPWQLYLICAAARLKPLQCFGSSVAQRRLSSIVQAVNSRRGFIYPHSGDGLSVRTNGILYDVLALIKEEMKPRSFMLRPFYIWDNIRVFFGSQLVRAATILVILALIVAGIWDWVRKPDASIGDLGPELLGGVLLFVLSSRKEV